MISPEEQKISELEQLVKRQSLFLVFLQKKIEKMEREHRRMNIAIDRLERRNAK